MKYITILSIVLLSGCVKKTRECTVCFAMTPPVCTTTEVETDEDLQPLIDFWTGGDPTIGYTVSCDWWGQLTLISHKPNQKWQKYKKDQPQTPQWKRPTRTGSITRMNGAGEGKLLKSRWVVESQQQNQSRHHFQNQSHDKIALRNFHRSCNPIFLLQNWRRKCSTKEIWSHSLITAWATIEEAWLLHTPNWITTKTVWRK